MPCTQTIFFFFYKCKTKSTHAMNTSSTKFAIAKILPAKILLKVQ